MWIDFVYSEETPHPDLPLDTMIDVIFNDGFTIYGKTLGYWVGIGSNCFENRPVDIINGCSIVKYKVS